MHASRMAGFRLLWIIVLLLVPVSYLGSQLTFDRWAMAKATRAHLDGVALMDITLQVMLDLSRGENPSGQQPDLEKSGPNLAASSGVTPELDQFLKILNDTNKDRAAKLDAASALMSSIGASVSAAQSGDHEAHILANLASEKLPKLIDDYAALIEHVDQRVSDGVVSDAQLYTMQWEIADLEFEARDTSNGVHRARLASDDRGAFSPLLQPSWWVLFDTANFRTILSDRTTEPHALLTKLQVATSETAPKWNDSLRQIWAGLHERLQTIGRTRHAEFLAWASRSMAISAGAVLLGLGVAISMFRRTLRKLDEVELARREAIMARSEAESSADELAELNIHMSQNLKALKAAQDLLVKKGRMEQLGQLIAIIAHELRNPLGTVRTSAFLLERKTKGLGLGIEGQLQRINNGITRCDEIITQLLDFSRNKQIVASSEDLDQWLEGAVSEEAQRLPAAVSISCVLGLEGLKVPFDPKRMHRAIGNLLSNASEAMVGNGEDASRFAVQNPQIVISTRREGDQICIEVRDNGPGIKGDVMARIREPLFTTKSFGTGLGLPAVEQILAQHHGSLQVDSELGKFASFCMRLPLTVVHEEAA
ncbi:sensor histidine kinase [Aestuariivirga litoralis]|uniref:sensor histidine kinase n=1 Tax=Aestuariivirga litoralis TaxID=2650924 RepID=UPI0018C59FCD|nr:ATP-binding protein [Aestuariivirga litoralis]MBG1231194.1 GHKL domain-containing protein [Aestuariivirga litoralis]